MADTTTSKPWYKSKTIISDIATVLFGVYMVLQPILAAHGINLPALSTGVDAIIFSVLGALGIYGRTDATGKITFSTTQS